MLNRLLTAMALACVMAMPIHAEPNEAREFYRSQSVKLPPKDQGRHPGMTGKRSEISGSVLSIAKRYLGTNPTKMRRLWCAAFVGLIERKVGRAGTGSNLAKSYARYGRSVPLRQARAGDIVVTGRRGGGHVGFALGPPVGGRIKMISGNSGGRGPGRRVVAIGNYPIGRVIAVRRAS